MELVHETTGAYHSATPVQSKRLCKATNCRSMCADLSFELLIIGDVVANIK